MVGRPGFFFALACAPLLSAQNGTPPAGLMADWEIAPVMREIGAHASRLAPLLDRIDVKSWIEKGASDTYAAQLQTAKEQVNAVAGAARAAAANPSQLSGALDLLFRVQAVDTLLKSIEEGLSRYQKPADAQELARLHGENGANRERLQSYVLNLAAEREKEFRAMDQEAQRCRGVLTQTPPKPGRKK
jgi:hypothetical protein